VAEDAELIEPALILPFEAAAFAPLLKEVLLPALILLLVTLALALLADAFVLLIAELVLIAAFLPVALIAADAFPEVAVAAEADLLAIEIAFFDPALIADLPCADTLAATFAALLLRVVFAAKAPVAAVASPALKPPLFTAILPFVDEDPFTLALFLLLVAASIDASVFVPTVAA